MKSSLIALGLLALCAIGVLAAEPTRVGLDGAELKPGEVAFLDLYPTGQKPAHGTVLISPGGGYSHLAATHEGSNVARMLNDAGWDAAVLFYHVNAGPTTRDFAATDAKQALALLQTRGAELGLATGRIGAMGFSAGGHLTARLAHETAGSHPPQFLILMYPAYLNKGDQVAEEVSPIPVPVFLYVAANDGFHVGGELYAATCKTQNIPCELHIPETGGHGFGLKAVLPEAVREWPGLLVKWLETNVEKKEQLSPSDPARSK